MGQVSRAFSDIKPSRLGAGGPFSLYKLKPSQYPCFLLLAAVCAGRSGIKTPASCELLGRRMVGLTETLASFVSFFSCKLLDSDQELYKNFPLVISERWQQEVAETVYDAVNADTDKIEARKRAKNKQLGHEEGNLSNTLLSIFYC